MRACWAAIPLWLPTTAPLVTRAFAPNLCAKSLRAATIPQCIAAAPLRSMRAVAAIAEEAGVPCWVSMEKRMACGVGACLSCVVETQAGKRRSCVDGPVFNAKELVW